VDINNQHDLAELILRVLKDRTDIQLIRTDGPADDRGRSPAVILAEGIISRKLLHDHIMEQTRKIFSGTTSRIRKGMFK
jgi:hypothetical protein